MTDRLTLDTNLLQEYWREQAKQDVVQQLLDFAKTEAAELVVTARIADDIPHGPLAERLRELPELGIAQIGGIFRLDHSALDGPDMLGSDIFIELQTRADAELLRRGRATVPDWRDWDHVHAHFVKNRDVFLTWDKRLVEASALWPSNFRSRRWHRRSISRLVLARPSSSGSIGRCAQASKI